MRLFRAPHRATYRGVGELCKNSCCHPDEEQGCHAPHADVVTIDHANTPCNLPAGLIWPGRASHKRRSAAAFSSSASQLLPLCHALVAHAKRSDRLHILALRCHWAGAIHPICFSQFAEATKHTLRVPLSGALLTMYLGYKDDRFQVAMLPPFTVPLQPL